MGSRPRRRQVDRPGHHAGLAACPRFLASRRWGRPPGRQGTTWARQDRHHRALPPHTARRRRKRGGCLRRSPEPQPADRLTCYSGPVGIDSFWLLGLRRSADNLESVRRTEALGLGGSVPSFEDANAELSQGRRRAVAAANRADIAATGLHRVPCPASKMPRRIIPLDGQVVGAHNHSSPSCSACRERGSRRSWPRHSHDFRERRSLHGSVRRWAQRASTRLPQRATSSATATPLLISGSAPQLEGVGTRPRGRDGTRSNNVGAEDAPVWRRSAR